MSKSINSKLIELQGLLKPVIKDGNNPHFKSKYATLSSTIEAVRPLLHQLGLSILQPIVDGKVQTVITDEQGSSIVSEITLPLNLTPQQVGSAITYFRRYTLTSLLALEVEDDDGNEASKPQVKKLPNLEFNSEAYDKVAKYIQTGGKIEEVKKKYTLTEQIENSLLLLK